MIKTIIMLILGIIFGILIAFPISKILIKRHKRKIVKESVKKILEQKERTFKTSKGKPIPLNYINDGEKVDFPKQINRELVETKLKEIKEFEQKIKDIKKGKARKKGEIKKSGSFKKKSKRGGK